MGTEGGPGGSLVDLLEWRKCLMMKNGKIKIVKYKRELRGEGNETWGETRLVVMVLVEYERSKSEKRMQEKIDMVRNLAMLDVRDMERKKEMKEKERENGFIYNGYCKVGELCCVLMVLGKREKTMGLCNESR